jgi:two-component system, OmpR family, KDP operon response regulator KdpE
MDGSARLLVVEDEPQMRRLLQVSLGRRGYDVHMAASGAEALDLLVSERFDGVLLDLGLPDMDGVEVCRTVRSWSTIPIIVVSARDDQQSKVAALDLGADDYVTKPFGIDELLARIRVCLRRQTPADGPVARFGDITLDLARRLVLREGESIHLTPTEYELFRVLARYAGRVVTHRQLLREARGAEYESDTPLLRVHMVGLRQKLSVSPALPGYIMTEPGIGYRLLA